MTVGWILQAILAATPLVTAQSPAPVGAPEIAIELRVFVHAAIEPATLDLAKTLLTEVLESAQIRVDWHQCGKSDAACGTDDAARAVIVRVLPAKLTDGHVCALANPGTAEGDVIMVFLPCHQDLVRTLRSKAVARSHPHLATLAIGRLLGLTIAHEIGHVLGLPHAPVGVMQARFDLGDLLDLGSSRLTFRPHEQLQMRQALPTRGNHPTQIGRSLGGGIP